MYTWKKKIQWGKIPNSQLDTWEIIAGPNPMMSSHVHVGTCSLTFYFHAITAEYYSTQECILFISTFHITDMPRFSKFYAKVDHLCASFKYQLPKENKYLYAHMQHAFDIHTSDLQHKTAPWVAKVHLNS